MDGVRTMGRSDRAEGQYVLTYRLVDPIREGGLEMFQPRGLGWPSLLLRVCRT